MTGSDNREAGRTPDDIIASEYVLGLLSFEDRQQVEKRLIGDAAFAQLILRWQDHFSGLNSAYEPVAPAPEILARIENRLFGSPPQEAKLSSGFWGSVVFWRSMTALTSALAAGAAAVAVIAISPAPSTHMSHMAELSSPNDPMAVRVDYDETTGKIIVTPTAAADPQQKSLELWLINADGKPSSLGIIDPGTNAEMIIPPEMRGTLRNGMTLAVSLEPYGGSPTGTPTGPVLASGTTRQL